MRKLIVSRHAATVEFIRTEAPEFRDAPVLTEVTAADVQGAIVAGNLPLHLAALAAEIWAVEFTGDPPLGRDLTLDEMRRAGAVIRRYRVERLPDPEELRRSVQAVAR